MAQNTAIIIGAGPAGLTVAYELLKRTDIRPIVLERDREYVGGISRTVNYKGNRIDIGGHRFFSKSDTVMRWWGDILPVRLDAGVTADITYQRTTRALTEGMPRAQGNEGERVMHVRPRKTHIVYRGDFYAYPIELSWDTLRKLGLKKTARIGCTYVQAALFPICPERTLEDFLINRFGRELYKTFFRSYTEKVWGVPCREMSAEWGAQRIKGLSVTKAIQHAAKRILCIGALSGKSVETSLIEQFLYPTYGPGFLWEIVAERVRVRGGEIVMGMEVKDIVLHDDAVRIVGVDSAGEEHLFEGAYVFSTTDVRALIGMLDPPAPEGVQRVAEGLQYRDFLTVGLLLEDPPRDRSGMPITDTWMYVHEPDVSVGRVQLFHNWHPAMVAVEGRGWIGLEYFCTEGDALWQKSDEALIEQAARELAAIGLLEGSRVLDGTVIRQPKAYPGYFGSYDNFDTVRSFLDTVPNLYPIGRNGMHRYNNQDHSMLAAMVAVDCVLEGGGKERIWRINSEEEYHERK